MILLIYHLARQLPTIEFSNVFIYFSLPVIIVDNISQNTFILQKLCSIKIITSVGFQVAGLTQGPVIIIVVYE